MSGKLAVHSGIDGNVSADNAAHLASHASAMSTSDSIALAAAILSAFVLLFSVAAYWLTTRSGKATTTVDI